MRHKVFISFFILFFVVGCAGSNYSIEEREIILNKLSAVKYGNTSRPVYNSDKSFSIVYKQEKAIANNPNPFLRFFIYDMEKQEIILEDSAVGGKIRWRDNDRIEVTVTPGNISTELNDSMNGYIYNVRLKTKTSINFSTENPKN